ncbi:MAG TPA: PP0621 family protein [Thermoanaerobaculia bacterium]|nr:PP0621 family protein [Thermoanaerobaculia bacterium]
MTRFIVIVLLLVILWLSVQNFVQRLRASLGGGETRRSVPLSSRSRVERIEEMVRCTVCGTHVPSSRALKSAGGGGEVFCSEECRHSRTPSA